MRSVYLDEGRWASLKQSLLLTRLVAVPRTIHHLSKMNSSDLSKTQPNSSNRAPLPPIRECRVVVERLPDAVQLKSLESSPENPHSASSRLASDKRYLDTILKKDKINWPSMDDDEAWSDLDSSVRSLLSVSIPIADRIKLLEETILSKASQLFGFQPPKNQPKNPPQNNRKFLDLIKLKNDTNAQIAQCSSPLELEGLHQILAKAKSDIRIMRKNKRSRKKRWKIKNQRNAFRTNPWKTGKDILRPRSNVSLKVSQEEMDNHMSKTNADPLKDVPLQPLPGLPDPPMVKVPFVTSKFDFKKFQRLLVTRRNGSSPGSNGIPYKVYKRCDMISSYIFDIFNRCAKKGIVPIMWRHAFVCFVPKVDSPSDSKILDFRQIALINVEGKLFFSLVSSRITSHIVHKNHFIDTSIQKGCMEGIPGCWEHISMIWDTFKDARLNNKSAATVWLDVANAYGSIPHQLIFLALKRYGVADSWINLIMSYYGGLWSKSCSESAPSDWHVSERGIFTGCTVSIILFLAGFNVIIEYTTLVDFQGFITSSQTVLPMARAFMDDVNLLSTCTPHTNTLLERCTVALAWSRMEVRASKSRSLVMVNGKVCPDLSFSIPIGSLDPSHVIPSILNLLVKFLGRKIDGTLTDRVRVAEIDKHLTESLQLIDNSYQLGVNKVWIMQNLLLPQIRWLVTIYELPMSTAVDLEQRLSRFIRKWLGLHKSTSSTGFYNSLAPCPLPLKSFTSILKASKTSAYLLLRDSKDPLVASSVPRILTGNSWHVEEAVRLAEGELDFQSKFGQHQFGRAGFGLNPVKPSPAIGTREYRRMISDIVCKQDDKRRFSEAVQMSVQGQWTAWCNYVQTNLSWATIWALPANLISFCLGATYDTLPSPSNLKRWSIKDEDECSLCSRKQATVSHILSGCPVSLQGGRYTMRHDSVLLIIFKSLKSFISNVKPTRKSKIVPIKFVKAGQPARSGKSPIQGLLHQAGDWVMLSDFNSSLVFPVHIAITSHRPDIVIYSDSLRMVLLIELTCPCEENFSDRHLDKNNKYINLCDLIEANGWICKFFAIEVGARGYCSRSVGTFLKAAGFPPKLSKKLQSDVAFASMKASFKIWLARDNKDWVPETISLPEDPSPPKVQSISQPGPVPRSVSTSTQCNLPISPSPPVTTPTPLSTVPTSSHTKLCSIPVGLVNHGNTCYINCILQVLQVFPRFWLASSNVQTVSPFLKSLFLLLSLMKNGSHKLDPKFFLSQLGSLISRERGTSFIVNKPQDSSEVFQYILTELVKGCPESYKMICSEVCDTSTCNTCFLASSQTSLHTTIRVPVSDSLLDSVSLFLLKDQNSKTDKKFCHSCNSIQEFALERNFSVLPDILMVNIDRNVLFGNTLIKDDRRLIFTDKLILSSSCEDDISIRREYTLRAVVNHSGSTLSGHYTAHVKFSDTWFFCNDTLVSKCNLSSCNPSTVSSLFFERS